MAWNWKVSFSFCCFELLICFFLIQRKYSLRDKWYSLILGLIAFQEFLQGITWLYIAQEPFYCSIQNVISSCFLNVIPWLIPISNCLFYLKSNSKSGNQSIIKGILGITLIWYLIRLFLLYISPLECIFAGPNGNQIWSPIISSQFFTRISKISFERTYELISLLYFLYIPFLSLVAFFFYQPYQITIILFFVGMIYSILSYVYYVSTREFDSVWCWLSFVYIIPFILDPYIVDKKFLACFSRNISYKTKVE